MDINDIECLIDEYGNIIYSFCRKLAINKDDADDLYQQTFLRALELRDKIAKDKNPKNFLITISISIWKNSIRKKARRNRIAPTINIDDYNSKDILEHIQGVEGEAITNELHREVNIIVSNLKDKFRVPIIMYYNAEVPIYDIAYSLKIPKGTVKSRLYRGRLLIKKELEARGYEGFT